MGHDPGRWALLALVFFAVSVVVLTGMAIAVVPSIGHFYVKHSLCVGVQCVLPRIG